MDLNDIRIGVTLVSFGLFLALVVHTWSARRLREHEAAEALPFMEEDTPAVAGAAAVQGERRE